MTQRDMQDRPTGACACCQPPTGDRPWRPADPGYKTCSRCLDRLRCTLQDVVRRWLMLNPRPGTTGGHGTRGAPGFGSRSPGSDHIIVMQDWRSKSHEISRDGAAYIWDPNADHGHHLDPGVHGPERPPGGFVEKRDVWYGADGRGHSEEPHPPRSIPMALASLAGLVAEEREISPPTTRRVPDLARWLDQHLDYVTRQDWVVDMAAELAELVAQLRPATGDKRSRIGNCPATRQDVDPPETCGAPLYAPTSGDTIHCRACGTRWERPAWEELGKALQARREHAA